MTPVVEYPGGTVKVKIVFEPLTLSGKIYVWVHASGYSSAENAVAHRPLSSTSASIKTFFMSSPFRAENEIAPGKARGRSTLLPQKSDGPFPSGVENFTGTPKIAHWY